jgi:hypothetical protein
MSVGGDGDRGISIRCTKITRNYHHVLRSKEKNQSRKRMILKIDFPVA